MTVTNQDILDAILRPMHEALQSQGITALYLAKKLKKELNAKEVKVFNVKGTDQIIYSKPLISWSVRQRARIDAHRLLNHYPPEKHELTGANGGPLKVTLADRLKEISESDAETGGEI